MSKPTGLLWLKEGELPVTSEDLPLYHVNEFVFSTPVHPLSHQNVSIIRTASGIYTQIRALPKTTGG